MSEKEYCLKYKKFSEFKREVKNRLWELFNDLSNNYEDRIIYTIGLSIYEKREIEKDRYYIVLYSINIYTNQYKKVLISENDFSGFVFDNITGINNIKKERKKFNYLSIFFKEIYRKEREEIEGDVIVYTINIGNYYIQISVVVDKIIKRMEEDLKKALKNLLEDKLFLCIKEADLEIKLKKGINLLKNEYILIIDLIRVDDRFDNKYKYMDALMTSKIIFEIKSIAGEANFKSISHTGDGFVFIYRGEEENILNDVKLFLNRTNDIFNEIRKYLENLNNVISAYRLRGIIEKCPLLFEIDYLNSTDKKLYFSSDLDNIFLNLLDLKDEEKLFKDNPSIIAIFKVDSSLKDLPNREKNIWIVK